MRKLKVYLETSVWNAAIDRREQKRLELTRAFLGGVQQDELEAYIGPPVINEIELATADEFRQMSELIQNHGPTLLDTEPEIERLAMRYIEDGALPRAAKVDAQHIAHATFYELDAIVSWNMRHIANIRRQLAVQGINFSEGYQKLLLLTTPQQVMDYEVE